jgi:hypothetical protein
MNVTLYHREVRKSGDNKGDDFWKAAGYFGTPAAAYDFIIDKEIMGTGLSDFKTIINKINELKKEN